MKYQFTFKKLYQKVKEGEYIYAIVAYANDPCLIKKYPDGYLKSWTSTNPYENETYIAQYRKMLRIDLLFVYIYFEWTSKEITY